MLTQKGVFKFSPVQMQNNINYILFFIIIIQNTFFTRLKCAICIMIASNKYPNKYVFNVQIYDLTEINYKSTRSFGIKYICQICISLKYNIQIKII